MTATNCEITALQLTFVDNVYLRHQAEINDVVVIEKQDDVSIASAHSVEHVGENPGVSRCQLEEETMQLFVVYVPVFYAKTTVADCHEYIHR